MPETTSPQAVGDRQLVQHARVLLGNLYAAMRALRLYPMENQVVQSTLRDLYRAAVGLLEREDAIAVRLVGETFFVNDLRLRADLASFAVLGGVGRAMRMHEIGSIEVEPGVTLEEWTHAISLLVADPPDEGDAHAKIAGRLEARGVKHIRFGEGSEREDDPAGGEGREPAKRAYVQSVAVARDLMNGVRLGKGVSLRRVKRSVQSIVDQVLANETSIVGMTTLRDYDEYTFTHSVNVCIFSVALGKKLGLEKSQLYELGLGALLHDIGKIRMPVEVINKPGSLDAAEWALMKEHPTEGLLTLFNMHGFVEYPLRAMLMIYEHHMKVDLTGYPVVRRPRTPTLFPRIVAVADAFDAATSKRSYQSEPWPADQVLREMQENPERGFDRLLVKAFISMTGIYPIGSVVILDSYELAVVVASNSPAGTVDRPVVKVIYDSLGVPLDKPRLMDLSETDNTGRPKLTIVKTTDPERYGIDVADYFS